MSQEPREFPSARSLMTLYSPSSMSFDREAAQLGKVIACLPPFRVSMFRSTILVKAGFGIKTPFVEWWDVNDGVGSIRSIMTPV